MQQGINFPAQQRTPIIGITIGSRRREDMGDIDALAESIRKYGLLHPIILDEKRNLVAGGRRLEACKSLGWTEVPTRMLGELSEDELREIELEENLQRKDLTELERSRDMVELIEIAVKINEASISSEVRTKPQGGRPPRPDSIRAVSEKTGIPRQTIQDAKKHVEAAERYPELRSFPKMDAIKAAKTLDSMPEEKRAATIEKIRHHDPDTVALVTGKPPMPKTESTQSRLKRDPEWWFRKATHDLWVLINSTKANGGVEAFVGKLSVEERSYAIDTLRALESELASWRIAIESKPLVRRVL